MLSLIDDAIDVADTAVKQADAAERAVAAPEVSIVKVAREQCKSAARALINTGAFRDYREADLVDALETAGPAECLRFMEKLAAMAVFPLDIGNDVHGTLVEKPDKRQRSGSDSDTMTSRWKRALEEVDAEG